jgi:prepilin-type N-terminal cleavage/methylation domain-containing protein
VTSKQKGFTLIELIIVIAIIAILAAIAIPAYQVYLISTQVSEDAVLTDGTKIAVRGFYGNIGRFAAKRASRPWLVPRALPVSMCLVSTPLPIRAGLAPPTIRATAQGNPRLHVCAVGHHSCWTDCMDLHQGLGGKEIFANRLPLAICGAVGSIRRIAALCGAPFG